MQSEPLWQVFRRNQRAGVIENASDENVSQAGRDRLDWLFEASRLGFSPWTVVRLFTLSMMTRPYWIR